MSLPLFLLLHVGIVGHATEANKNSTSNLTSAAFPWQASTRWIGYGFKLDGNAPNFVRDAKRIFEFPDNDPDIDVVPLTRASTEYIATSSLAETSRAFSVSVGVSASYLAFSGAVETSVSSSSSFKHKQLYAIHKTDCPQVKVKNNAFGAPAAKLRDSAKEFIQQASAQEIVDEVGEFYAIEIVMGGVIQTVFQQTQTSTSESSSFSQSVEAEASNLVASVSAKGGFSHESSATGSAESLSVSVKAQGGDTSVWLSGGSFADNQREWAKTFNADNLYPMSLQLVPIWKVVDGIDSGKASSIKDLLLSRWSADGINLDALDQLDIKTDSWDNKVVNIFNVNSGKVVNAEGNGKDDGTNVWLWNNPWESSSQWRILSASRWNGPKDAYVFEDLNSQKVLNVEGNGRENGDNVWLWSNPHEASSQWRIRPASHWGGGHDAFVLENCNSYKVMNALGDGVKDGTDVRQWDNPLQTSSQWKLISARLASEVHI